MGLKVKGIVCQTDNAQAVYTCTPLFGAGPSSWLNLQPRAGNGNPPPRKEQKNNPSLPSYIELDSQHMLSQSHFRKKVKY